MNFTTKKVFKVLLLFVALFVAAPLVAQDFNFGETLRNFGEETGFAQMFATEGGWKTLIMLVISCFLLYLAIVKKYEPLLLLPIAFGMLLVNIYPDIMKMPGEGGGDGGLLAYFYKLDEWAILPSLMVS